MKTFVVIKAINHNVLQVKNSHSEECIVFGKGIGFQKKAGDTINQSDVEKVYFTKDSKNRTIYQRLVEICDERLVTAVERAIDRVFAQLGVDPNENLRIALLDHLNFSIYRLNHGLSISNMFIDELQIMYEMEAGIARSLMKEINDEMSIQLPESEIGFITLHIHASIKKEQASMSNLYFDIIAKSLSFLKTQYGIDYEQDQLKKVRLMTHLKFALKRAHDQTLVRKEISLDIKQSFPKAYAIASSLAEFIHSMYDIRFLDTEIGYLAIHIEHIKNH